MKTKVAHPRSRVNNAVAFLVYQKEGGKRIVA